MTKSGQSRNLVAYRGAVQRTHRERLLGQKSAAVWFTGLSGAGKSTIAHAVEERLHAMGRLTYVFDGDNVRHGLCADLGFTPEDRAENMRRIAEMIKLFMDAGMICLTAFISPARANRDLVRGVLGTERFYEIYVKCPAHVCRLRDAKGFYSLAAAGKIRDYTGVSAPYEPPEAPDLILDTERDALDVCVEETLKLLRTRL